MPIIKFQLILEIIFAFVLITAVSIFSLRAPLTLFYRYQTNVAKDIERKLNAQRAIRDIKSHFKESKRNDNLQIPLFSNANSTELCIGIMTVPRQDKDLQYLTQTMASLLTRSNWFSPVQMFIFNQSFNVAHDELDSIKGLVSIKTPTLVDESLMKLLERHKHLRNQNKFKYFKQCIDYLTVLKSLMNVKECKRILVLEDDVIAANDWYNKILYFDKKREELVGNRWIYLKLFSTFEFNGWNASPTHIIQLLFLSLFLSIAINFILKMVFKLLTSTISINEWDTFGLVKWVILMATCVLVFFIIGRQNLFMRFPDKTVQIFDIGSMAQAVLWNKKILPQYIKFLKERIEDDGLEILPIDLLFAEFQKEFNEDKKEKDNYEVLITVPDIFQHIGLSSNFYRRNKSILVRSYNFLDDDKPIELSLDIQKS